MQWSSEVRTLSCNALSWVRKPSKKLKKGLLHIITFYRETLHKISISLHDFFHMTCTKLKLCEGKIYNELNQSNANLCEL